jgi:putative spermidine/putrescine transport system permease protein
MATVISAETRWRPLPFLLPGALVLLVLFCLPVGYALYLSFLPYDPIGGIDYRSPTLTNYLRFWQQPFYARVILRTLRVSLTTTVLCFLIGYPVAYYLRGRRRSVQSALLLVYVSPWLVSVVVKAYGWMILLAPNGLLNRALLGLGVVAQPVQIMWTETAIVIGLVHVYLVFMIVPVFTALLAVDDQLLRAAATLGARRAERFRRITFPLSMPGVVAGSLLVFSLTMSAFATPALLGGDRVKVMSFVAFEQSLILLNWPFGSAVAFILLGATSGVVYFYQRRTHRLASGFGA